MSFTTRTARRGRLAGQLTIISLFALSAGCRDVAPYALAPGDSRDGALVDQNRVDARGCGPATCSGCCEPDGSCLSGTSLDACGVGGRACDKCQQSLAGCTTPVCEKGTCIDQDVPDGAQCKNGVCHQGNCCTGCYGGASCLTGDTAASCGIGGEPCKSCDPGPCSAASCSAGKCKATPAPGQPCNDTTDGAPGRCDKGGACCTGCRDATDTCQAGDGLTACGVDGQTCTSCATVDVCFVGACVSKTTVCGTSCAGCCDTASTQCIQLPEQTAKQCGVGSIACADCGPKKICKDGHCVWALLGCRVSCLNGCCTAGEACVSWPTQTQDVCGTLGGDCHACGPGQSCKGGFCN